MKFSKESLDENGNTHFLDTVMLSNNGVGNDTTNIQLMLGNSNLLMNEDLPMQSSLDDQTFKSKLFFE